MVTANLATIVGLSLVAAALIAVFFFALSSLVEFYGGGYGVLGILEVIRLGVQAVFEMPITYSYLTALTSAMLIVTMLLLREDRRAERALAQRRCIEHTPVYEDDQQQCSSR